MWVQCGPDYKPVCSQRGVGSVRFLPFIWRELTNTSLPLKRVTENTHGTGYTPPSVRPSASARLLLSFQREKSRPETRSVKSQRRSWQGRRKKKKMKGSRYLNVRETGAELTRPIKITPREHRTLNNFVPFFLPPEIITYLPLFSFTFMLAATEESSSGFCYSK